ncbi:MAG TPA: hypothetical protein VGZ47_11945 [Gemmataceae bacterium]|jgi:hypothetical protein|nr:hypothetical protein [Gemmataceae bacterium]
MRRALMIGGIVFAFLLVGVCVGLPIYGWLTSGNWIFVDVYADNATAQEVTVEFDGETWGNVVAGAYQKYEGKRIKPGKHTFVVYRASDRTELEHGAEMIEDYGPWVLNVQGGQTYLQVSDYDLETKEKFDIRDGHRQSWFRAENGFTMVKPDIPFGLFPYSPNISHTIRWSEIPETRRAKGDATHPDPK